VTSPRFPIEPWLAAATAKLHFLLDNPGVATNANRSRPVPYKTIADYLGMARNNIEHARRRGLSFDQCDRWAIRLGYHPAELWPDWMEHSLSIPPEVEAKRQHADRERANKRRRQERSTLAAANAGAPNPSTTAMYSNSRGTSSSDRKPTATSTANTATASR
jgi:hypothetical protein